jgi:hypothetical protein
VKTPTVLAHRADPPTVAECVESPAHSGRLEGSARTGRAAQDGRIVEIGWFADGRVRFRATTCAPLIAYAEVACAALEAGIPPGELDARALHALVRGVHPDHLVRAALVATAIRTACFVETP